MLIHRETVSLDEREHVERVNGISIVFAGWQRFITDRRLTFLGGHTVRMRVPMPMTVAVMVRVGMPVMVFGAKEPKVIMGLLRVSRILSARSGVRMRDRHALNDQQQPQDCGDDSTQHNLIFACQVAITLAQSNANYKILPGPWRATWRIFAVFPSLSAHAVVCARTQALRRWPLLTSTDSSDASRAARDGQ
ncbi:MAG: hypothetical protein AB7K24_30595 [Gemmataceae bacterium]